MPLRLAPALGPDATLAGTYPTVQVGSNSTGPLDPAHRPRCAPGPIGLAFRISESHS